MSAVRAFSAWRDAATGPRGSMTTDMVRRTSPTAGGARGSRGRCRCGATPRPSTWCARCRRLGVDHWTSTPIGQGRSSWPVREDSTDCVPGRRARRGDTAPADRVGRPCGGARGVRAAGAPRSSDASRSHGGERSGGDNTAPTSIDASVNRRRRAATSRREPSMLPPLHLPADLDGPPHGRRGCSPPRAPRGGASSAIRLPPMRRRRRVDRRTAGPSDRRPRGEQSGNRTASAGTTRSTHCRRCTDDPSRARDARHS